MLSVLTRPERRSTHAPGSLHPRDEKRANDQSSELVLIDGNMSRKQRCSRAAYELGRRVAFVVVCGRGVQNAGMAPPLRTPD